MEVVCIDGIDPEWDRLVWNSPGGTIFHTLRFLSYHPPSRFDFANLAVKEAGRCVCVIPGGPLATEEGTHYVSPLGASFGGFVFTDDCDLRTMFEAIEAFTEYARERGFAAVEVSLPPSCYSRSRGQALGFAMTSSGFRMSSREATSVVPLDQVEPEKLAPALRRNVRKATRSGVTVARGDNYRVFHEILAANLRAKGTDPTHTAAELEKLHELFPDRMQLLEAWHDDRMVGGCLSFICNSRAAIAFYICDDPDLRQFRIAESVLHATLARFKEEGYRYLDLGTISRDGQVNWGLARFKAKFMAETYVRERYTLGLGG